MNPALEALAKQCRLDATDREALRFAFAYACASRVRHLLEEPRAVDCLDVLRRYVAGEEHVGELADAAAEVAGLANRHRGSSSIDGTAHAAVSATFAVAKALAGEALEAANYAAYATVYAYGGYAVNDPGAFEPEHAWQVNALRECVENAVKLESDPN